MKIYIKHALYFFIIELSGDANQNDSLVFVFFDILYLIKSKVLSFFNERIPQTVFEANNRSQRLRTAPKIKFGSPIKVIIRAVSVLKAII